MTFPKSRQVWVSILLLGTVASAAASDSLKLTLDPVFDGTPSYQGVCPIVADLENSGPDAHGVLRVSSDLSQILYPIDLPRGANKRLITYPNLGYGEVHFSLETDQGKVDKEFADRSDSVEGSRVLLIGDAPGALAFITPPPSSTPTRGPAEDAKTLVPCYSKPGEGPTRPVGYSGVTTIILGSGSERLTDEEVQAIKLWVVTGGTLTFLGGVSSPVLSDRRWADLLPGHNFQIVQKNHPFTLSDLGGAEAPPVTETTVNLARGATPGRDGLSAEKPYGLGKTIFITFNPLEPPLNKWSGRRVALTKILRVQDNFSANVFLQAYSGERADNTASAGSPTGMPPTSSIEDDPFSMTLPPTSRIFMILLGYFIAVVPVNFLVLKKLKRGELAWFTAPVISLVFAGILFESASSLYGAKMSTVSDGLILAQEGDPDGMFVGKTEMFIPHAGSYDLNLKDVDTLGTVATQDYRYGPSWQDQENDLEPVDLGEIKLPNLQANNLAFRRIAYRQRIPISNWFHITLESTGEHTARCEVTNTSPYTLRGAAVAYGKTNHPISDLPPGKTLAISVSFAPSTRPEDLASGDIRMFTARNERAALTGKLDGFRPGPQIGTDVPNRTAITLALFSKWKAGSL